MTMIKIFKSMEVAGLHKLVRVLSLAFCLLISMKLNSFAFDINSKILEFIDSYDIENIRDGKKIENITTIKNTLFTYMIAGLAYDSSPLKNEQEIIQNNYNRNNNMPSSISYNEVTNGEKFEKLPFQQSVFHTIGTKNNGDYVYEKYVSTPDGKTEYVFATKEENGKKVAYKVENLINAGTYNYYGPSEGNKHFIYDVIPWLLYGTAPENEGDPTNFLYRFRLLVMAALYTKALNDGNFEEYQKIKGEIFALLDDCSCEGREEWMINPVGTVTPPVIPTPPPVVIEPPVTPPPPVADIRYRGFIAGTVGAGSLFTYNARTLDYGKTVLRSGTNTIETNDGAVTINVNADFGGYSYTAWGRWEADDVSGTLPFYPGSNLEKGHWVIGRVTSPTEFQHRVDRRSSAHYEGRLAGTSFQGGTVGGVISLDANLANRMIGGTVNFTHNGSSWVNGTFLPTSIDVGSHSVTYDGDLSIQGGGAGNLGGMFFGPNAEETGGAWAIWNVPDSIGGADGVFRAKE
jgi:hypothetical protein